MIQNDGEAIWCRNSVFVEFLASVLSSKFADRCVIEVEKKGGHFWEALYSLPRDENGLFVYLRVCTKGDSWFAVATTGVEILPFLQHADQLASKNQFADMLHKWISWDEYNASTESSGSSEWSEGDYALEQDMLTCEYFEGVEWKEQDLETPAGCISDNDGLQYESAACEDEAADEFDFESEHMPPQYNHWTALPTPEGHPNKPRELYWEAIRSKELVAWTFPQHQTEEHFAERHRCGHFAVWLFEELPHAECIHNQEIFIERNWEMLYRLGSGNRRCYIFLEVFDCSEGAFALAPDLLTIARPMGLPLSPLRYEAALLKFEAYLLKRLFDKRLQELDRHLSEGPPRDDEEEGDEDEEGWEQERDERWEMWEEEGGWEYELNEQDGEWGYKGDLDGIEENEEDEERVYRVELDDLEEEDY
jgi:hypothetical protein